MLYIAIGNVVVFFLDLLSSGYFSALLAFIPAYILQGQVWRIVTFIFIPVNSSPLWFILSLLLYYGLGTTLEQIWGTAKFTLYYLLGILFTLVAAIIAAVANPLYSVLPVANMYYVNMSLFFAYATLNPDAIFRIYFILPLKAKWLAWLDALLFAIDACRYIGMGMWPMALVIVLAFLNYFLFFGSDIGVLFGRVKQRGQYKRRTIDFENAKRQQENLHRSQGYTHKCAVCGKTDADDPNEQFRYCSKCNGYYCYCSEHISNHVHIQ
ncbi:MAG: hypothetical protein HFF09_06445 [Oscillospiraceae bacterium]|nr:hypothetical protein [Oscillospiraceae bacterium]